MDARTKSPGSPSSMPKKRDDSSQDSPNKAESRPGPRPVQLARLVATWRVLHRASFVPRDAASARIAARSPAESFGQNVASRAKSGSAV